MTPALNRTMSRLEWGMLVLLSLLWGGSFFLNGVALKELPPLTVVVLRVGLAAAFLHLLLPLMGQRMPRDGALWRAFLVMGLVNNAIPIGLIAWGQTQIASGLASILNATTPLFGVIVAHLFTADERMTGGRLAGVLVGFAGVVVMIGPAAMGGLGADVAAQAAVLAGALSYALAGVYGRRFRRMGATPIVTAAGQVTASTAILLPLALVAEQPWTLPSPSLAVVVAVLGLALLSTVLGYILYFRILASAGATNILLVTFLIPVSAIVLGSLVLGERLDPRHFAGMALIGCGLAAIDGRLLSPFRTRMVPDGR
ncbi:MAG TPA: DMT family transporter [Microvirga sp.]|jgi:drug/metabolite transporter (DMT)-like permease|nr:DMT family transporter [Microvirga sp.]